ncbi:MAG: hypothetical protein ACJAYX_003414 [Planctomycetota bacterium]|jgi:hypothetical protein
MPLQVTAVVLGIAIVVLLVKWLDQDPPPPSQSIVAATPKTHSKQSDSHSDTPQAATPNEDVTTSTADEHEAVIGPTSAVLYGTIKSADGKPVEGHMWLWDDNGSIGATELRGSNTAFAFPGLQPGTYRLTSRFSDQFPIALELQVTAPRTRLDHVLAPTWQLTVHAVTPEGASLKRAVAQDLPTVHHGDELRVVAQLETLTTDLQPGIRSTDAAGLGIFRGADPFRETVMAKTTVGVLTLPPDQAVHVALMLSNTLLAQQLVKVGTSEITFTLTSEDLLSKTATVRVRVVDQNGTAVAGAMANIGSSFNPNSKTDDQGRYVFKKVLPGRRTFRAQVTGMNSQTLEIDIPASADIDLGDIVMRAPAKFTMDLANFGGSGGVYLSQLNGTRQPERRIRFHYVSAQDDKQKKVQLFPGRYSAYAYSKAGVTVRTLDTAVIAGQVVRFDLSKGANLRIVGKLQLPVPIEILDATGQTVTRREFTGAQEVSIRLPVGAYQIKITHAGGAVTSKSVQLTADGATVHLPE